MKRALGVAALLVLTGAGFGLWTTVGRGFSARDEPSAPEAGVARFMRRLAVPRATRAARNPITLTPDVLKDAREHFADHCASCHGNDGRGQTTLGRNLYPKAPDMSAAVTQSLSDGEIFAVIENGIRLTGMPAWGDGSATSTRATWGLVHFIRHLPRIDAKELDEMRGLNPKSRRELEEEDEIRRFLAGEDAPAH
jgi:mono/diheme cytochrome c family protein